MIDNLPPGLSANSIPGNDTSWDDLICWLDREAIRSGLSIEDCKTAFLAGINSVKVMGAEDIRQFLRASGIGPD